MSGPSERLSMLADICRGAGEIAQLSRKKATSELKGDGSIVTNGDKDAEAFLRPKLIELVPGSTVWGEEFGYEPEGESGLWVVDPIDGTSNFSFGGINWGVSAALVRGSFVELGAVFLPDIGEMYLGERRQGAWMNEKPLAPSPPGPILDHELVSFDDGLVRAHPAADLPGKMRCTGSFVVDGTNVATQRFRGMIGRREHLYDIAACVLMNLELGAEIRYANGDAFEIHALSGGQKINRPWIMFPRDSGFKLP